MNLRINDEYTTLENVRTVAQMLEVVNPSAARVAVMVNGAVIKAEERGTHVLRDGDNVEILTFAGGG